MDLLYEAASNYQELLNKKYHIKAVYKDETIELSFTFLIEHFYHLIGFHKLLDMKHITRPKFLYTRILSKKITYATIEGSKFLEEMQERIRYFHHINQLINRLQSGNIVIEFSNTNRTRIRADFLLYDLMDNGYTHLFLRKDKAYGYVPCSFFCRNDDKYIRNNKKCRVKEFTITMNKNKQTQ